MGLEQFFESISYICIKLLPLLGVVVCIYLIIVLRNLIVCLKNAAKTFDEANIQLRKLDVPLNTVSEISKSVDYVHDLTKESLKSISMNIFQALNELKSWVMNLLHKEDEIKSDEVVLNDDSQISE